MEQEIILGTAESLSDLRLLLNRRKKGVILLETMVDCGDCLLNCYPGIVLRGRNNTCGLKFAVDVFEEPLLRMHYDSRLENLTLDFVIGKVSPDANFGCILVQEYGVSFGYVRINHSVLKETWGRDSSVAALYLQHPLMADGNMSVNIQGSFAAAVKGDNSATARFLAQEASVSIFARDVSFPTIEHCLFEVSGALGTFFLYDNSDLKCDDFTNAYVLISGKAEVYCTLQNAVLKKVPFDLDKEKQRLFIIKNPLKKVSPKRCFNWPFVSCR